MPGWWGSAGWKGWPQVRGALAWRPDLSPWLLGAGCCAAWLGAGAAVWAATAGALPGAVPFFAVGLAAWGAGWLLLARGLWFAVGDEPPPGGAAVLLPRLPAVVGAGAVATVLPAAIAAAGGLLGGIWARDVTFALGAVVGAAVLPLTIEAVASLRDPASGAGTLRAVVPPALRRLLRVPRQLAALESTLVGCGVVWFLAGRLLGLYAHAFVPDPFLRAWFGWLADAGLAGALVQVYVTVHLGTMREVADGEPPEVDLPAPAPPARPSPVVGYVATAAVYLLLVVLVATQREALGLSHAVAGTVASPAVGRALGTAAQRQSARDQARLAVADAAAREALLVAVAGDDAVARPLATAALRINPRNPLGYQVEGLTALRQGDGAGVWGAADALLHVGATGPGYYLLSQACGALAHAKPPAKGARQCQANAAVQAMLAEPALAVLGLGPLPPLRRGAVYPPPAALPPSVALSRAVTRWAAVVAAPVTGGDEATSARALARAYLLRDMTRDMPPLAPAARAEIGVALMLAAGGVGDRGAMGDGAALLPQKGPLPVDLAEAVLGAGAAFDVSAPAHTGGAVATAVPPAIAKRALAAASLSGAPEALVRLAGEYDLLTANRSTGPVQSERGAIAFFSRALRSDPKAGALWTDLAVAQYELGKFDSAVTSAERAIQLGPDATAEAITADSLLAESQARGVSPARHHADLQSALTHFRRSLAENETPFLVWMAYGDTLVATGDPADAIPAYTAAEGYYWYDLVEHVDSFSAPHEGWAMTGMPGKGQGLRALQARIRVAQQQEKQNEARHAP